MASSTGFTATKQMEDFVGDNLMTAWYLNTKRQDTSLKSDSFTTGVEMNDLADSLQEENKKTVPECE